MKKHQLYINPSFHFLAVGFSVGTELINKLIKSTNTVNTFWSAKQPNTVGMTANLRWKSCGIIRSCQNLWPFINSRWTGVW